VHSIIKRSVDCSDLVCLNVNLSVHSNPIFYCQGPDCGFLAPDSSLVRAPAPTGPWPVDRRLHHLCDPSTIYRTDRNSTCPLSNLSRHTRFVQLPWPAAICIRITTRTSRVLFPLCRDSVVLAWSSGFLLEIQIIRVSAVISFAFVCQSIFRTNSSCFRGFQSSWVKRLLWRVALWITSRLM
jgi:hypothetical protein